jgi:hypothetical protein
MITTVKELDQALKPLFDLMSDISENAGTLDQAQVSELSGDLVIMRGLLKDYLAD